MRNQQELIPLNSPVDLKCDHCDAAMLYEKSSRSGSANLYCRICNTQHENKPENSDKNDKDDKQKNAQAA